MHWLMGCFGALVYVWIAVFCEVDWFIYAISWHVWQWALLLCSSPILPGFPHPPVYGIIPTVTYTHVSTQTEAHLSTIPSVEVPLILPHYPSPTDYSPTSPVPSPVYDIYIYDSDSQ